MSASAKLAQPTNQVLTDEQLSEVTLFLEQGGMDAKKILKVEDSKVTIHFTTSTGFSFYFQSYRLFELGEWVRYIYVDIALCRLADDELKKAVALFVCEQSINCVYPQKASINGDILSLSLRAPMSYINETKIRQILENSYDIAWSLFTHLQVNFPTLTQFVVVKTNIH